jgi:23S rRNA (pseudouridine1915-N3)-methyltransferase
MKIVLLVVGKTEAGCWKDALDIYKERLKHYLPFEIEEIPGLRNSRNISEAQQKEQEGILILKSIQEGDFCVLLDDKGRQYSSVQFAGYLEKKMHVVPRRLVFIVGGAFGFSKSVYDRSDELLSLSKMTFSHQMIRVIFVEQLYRALTIIRGESYHHE